MFNQGPFQKYDFPRVIITGTQICCGLRPTYLDLAKHRYVDQAALPSPYTSVQQILFGMIYFTKHRHLHQYHKRVLPPELATAGDEWRYIDVAFKPNGQFLSMYGGGSAPNFRHWYIDPQCGLMFTHYVAQMDQLASYINAHNLGQVTITPTWTNKKTSTALKTIIWHWNERVPTPESCNLTDFPFDASGKLIPGRTNLRDNRGMPVQHEVAPAQQIDTTEPPATEVAA